MALVKTQVPKDHCGIMILGEAPGRMEEQKGLPFVGGSGQLLDRLCKAVSLDRSRCIVGNVFQERPPKNDEGWFFNKRSIHKKLKYESPYPLYGTAGFLKPEYEYELVRLKGEILSLGVQMVIALGSLPLWALTGAQGIAKHRGFLMHSTLAPVKVLPTYHPAAVLRRYTLQSLVLHDLAKAKANNNLDPIYRPNRTIHIHPSVEDLKGWTSPLLNTTKISIDIETIPEVGLITCIGLAPNDKESYCIPFLYKDQPYWSPEELPEVIKWLSSILESSVPKVMQNGLYDLSYLTHYGFKVGGRVDDTMLLHHAFQPEMPKSLGVLASIYTREGPWKGMVSFSEHKKGV